MKPFPPLLHLLTSLCLGSAAMAAPVKIMPVGDSITQNSPGYHGHLARMLHDGNFDVDFVGSNKGRSPEGLDLDNEGHGGFTIGPGKSKGDDWTGGKGNIYVNVETYMKNDPDIILLMIGTNEYFNIGKLQPDYKPNETGAQKLSALVDRFHEVKPGVKIIVASIPPVAWDKNFASGINTKLPDLLKGKPNTIFVDMSKLCGFEKGDWSPDNLHPSDSGYKKIAKVWFDALTPILTKADKPLPPLAKVEPTQAASSAPKAPVAPGQPLSAGATVWDFNTQSPSYVYGGWGSVQASGSKTAEGWRVTAGANGGMGIVLGSGKDLSGSKSLRIALRKDAENACDIYLNLMLASGKRTYKIQASGAAGTSAEQIIDLSKPSEGSGDLSQVKQIQFQGTFNPSQKFAYTLGKITAE